MSTVSSSTQSTNYMQNLARNNRDGYAYNDEYGFAHVVKAYDTAVKYSGDGKIYSFNGKFGGGYALDSEGQRASLDLPDTEAYGNDIQNDHVPNASKGTFSLLKEVALSKSSAVYSQLAIADEEEHDETLMSSLKASEVQDYLAQIQLDLLSEKAEKAY